MKNESEIKAFTDLNAWREAHALVIAFYKLSQHFPKEEQFGLTSQMRRAAVSVSSNITEGFGRQTFKDKEHFYIMARGSLVELQSQLYVAKDVQYIKIDEFTDISDQATKVHAILGGLIRATKERAYA